MALLLLSVLLAGCGGGSTQAPGDGKTLDPPLEVASGAFDVTATRGFDTCGMSLAYGGQYDIVINGGDFTMGADWTGTWFPATASGAGESQHDVTTYRQCTVTTYTSVTITFETPDSFTGTITYRRRVSGECNTPCLTSWNIIGTRHQDPGTGTGGSR